MLSDRLAFYGWAVDLTVLTADAVRIEGVVSGFVRIGSGADAVADVAVTLPVPPGDDGWTIGLAKDTTVQLPSFGGILAMAGGESAVGAAIRAGPGGRNDARQTGREL